MSKNSIESILVEEIGPLRGTGHIVAQVSAIEPDSYGTLIIDVRRGAGSAYATRISVQHTGKVGENSGILIKHNSVTLPYKDGDGLKVYLEEYSSKKPLHEIRIVQ